MSWNKSVFSQMCTNVGYDDESQSMTVTWTNGRTSAYAGVPEDLALAVATAPSVGTMLNSDIKPNYPHRYL